MDESEAAAQVLTFGQKAVGLTFNPSGDEKVLKVKQLCAELIDILNGRMIANPEIGKNADVNLNVEAIKHIITAQMWAVKAITWKD